MARVMGEAEIPGTGLLVAANLQYLTGKPWAASTLQSLPHGDQRILLEPPGSRRLPSQTLLDLRVSRAFDLGGGNRVELIADVLNLLDDTAAESLATDNLFSPNFGQPAVMMDPRRVMFAARFSLAR